MRTYHSGMWIGGGKLREIEFDCKYLLPTEPTAPSDLLSLSEYRQWSTEKDRNDQEKRRKLLGKIVYNSGKKFQAGRDIRFWSCFVPNRGIWDTVSTKFGLPVSDKMDEEDIYAFGGGMETSTKGMPTGISIQLKPRGSAGYLPQFFILIDDPSLSFDIGRKYIQTRQQGMLKEIAYESFREYINNVRKYMGGGIDEAPSSWEKEEIFNTIAEIPNLNSAKTKFSKRPNGQEATVAAIFFELLGSGQIGDIVPLTSGYKGRYDLYAKWKNRNVVIEFKFNLSGLMKDFTDERKMFDEVDCVVLWEINEDDRFEAGRRGITVNEIQPSSIMTRERFPHSTQELLIESVKPLYVIELKRLLESP